MVSAPRGDYKALVSGTRNVAKFLAAEAVASIHKHPKRGGYERSLQRGEVSGHPMNRRLFE